MELQLNWGYVADTVMGGVSKGGGSREIYHGRDAVVLRGDVSLDNNGGFVQIAANLRDDGQAVDANHWHGIALDVCGNNEVYDFRLRTDQLTRPWQSFRAEFTATDTWQTIRFPFDDFESNNTTATFDPAQLRRVGVLGVGRVFTAEVAVSGIRFYHD